MMGAVHLLSSCACVPYGGHLCISCGGGGGGGGGGGSGKALEGEGDEGDVTPWHNSTEFKREGENKRVKQESV